MSLALPFRSAAPVAAEAIPGAAADPLAALDGVTVRTAGGTEVLSGVSLALAPGEALGIVGESGSGKTLTCLALLRLLPTGLALTGGSLRFRGQDLARLSPREMTALRGRGLAMIFQDPASSLNPMRRVGRFLTDLLGLHRGLRGPAAREEALALLRSVGIAEAERAFRAFPHELSGGQNQRAMIAGALAGRPALLIADEPTTALDVSTQAQILALLADLRARTGMGLLLVSHDFGVIAEAADRVAVMYAGRVVEEGPVRAVLAAPRHPYTAGLLGSIPPLDRTAPLAAIPGHPARPGEVAQGCAFAPRCAKAEAQCRAEVPQVRREGARAHACHRPLA